ncbi:MAG TPA: DNA-directed RNA polymerase subunit H [Methanomassiliicoccales archaeon]|nr:DNA-directed RNA polymerase subunit H [Methanomassiliicoccales archaeon]
MEESVPFNVLSHKMVPVHELLSDEEVDKVLKRLKVTRDQLPKIKENDACIKMLEKAMGRSIPERSIVRIVRDSETAEIAEIYRLVIRG